MARARVGERWTLRSPLVRTSQPSGAGRRGGEDGSTSDWVRWVFVASCAVVVVLGGFVMGPRRGADLVHNSVLNIIFDDAWVIGVARFAIAVVAVYLATSIAIHVIRDQWLDRAAGVEVTPENVEASTNQVVDDREILQEDLRFANTRIEELQGELSRLSAVLGDVSRQDPSGAPNGPAEMP